MKKMIAVLLAALMCTTMLLACGSTNQPTKAPDSGSTTAPASESKDTTPAPSDDNGHDDYWPDEPYHAKFILVVPNDNWPDAEIVNSKLNEIALRDLNIDLEVMQMTISTAVAQIPMMLAGGEQLDVFNNVGNIQINFDQAYVVDLLPYKAQIQPALDLLGEDDVMTGMLNGHLLALPGQLERAHRFGMAVRTDILNAVGYTAEDLVPCDIDQISAIFAAVHEKYPDMQIIDGSYSGNTPALNYQDCDYLVDGYGMLDNYGQTLTVTNYFEGDNFKEKLSWVKQWYDAGYIRKDASSRNDGYESLVKAGNTFGGMCPMKPDSKAEKDDQCGYDMTILYFKEDMLLGYGGGGYVVSGTSPEPLQAARLLNWVFTSREFNDTVNWGVEGIHWVEDENNPNIARFPEGMTAENQTYHNSWGWYYPNERIAHVWLGNDPDIFDKYAEAERTCYRTKAYGFHFDNTDYQDTIGALDNVKSEFYYELGNTGNMEIFDAFNSALYANGLQEIIDAKQTQLDEWCKANGITE